VLVRDFAAVRVVKLSDHPGDMLRQATQREGKQRPQATGQYEHAVKRHNVDVLRVVLLTHPRAKVGNCRRAKVHVFARTSDIIRLVRKVPQPLDQARQAKIEKLITADHHYHAHRGR
jgi:hypothetical protein